MGNYKERVRIKTKFKSSTPLGPVLVASALKCYDEWRLTWALNRIGKDQPINT